MKLSTRIVRALSFALLAGTLAACAAAPRHTDTYVSPSTGAVTAVESSRETCIRRCNSDFDRCSDTYAAGTQVGPSGDLGGTLGPAAGCKTEIRSCLQTCKGR